MALNTLKVIQHNVQHWKTRKTTLSNIYRHFDPDVILINSHCIPDTYIMRIPSYNIIKKNTLNNPADGTAIAVKRNIKYKILDDFISDLIAIEIETTTGKIILATLYQPPARNFIPIPDIIRLFRRQTPVYMIADLNANHPCLGYNYTNTKGRQIHTLIHNRTLQHRGPYFPTFYTQGRGTTPDIILTNYRTHHNIHITPGPLTSSDHIPILLTISSSPILIPAPKKPNLKQADWENFKKHINDNIADANLNLTEIENIDNAIENWHNTIDNAIKNHIPFTNHRQLPAPKLTEETKLTIIRFNALRQHSQQYGWDINHYRLYRTLQNTLEARMIEESNKNWHNLLEEVSATYKNPGIFWKKIKVITGNNIPEPEYLLNYNNTKIYKTEEKEELHRQHWSQIFEEEAEGEEEESEEIYQFLQNNLDRISPYDNTDTSRLGTCALDTQITPEEVGNVIKNIKKSSPGQSGINKTILQALPDKAITRLTHIYNNTISAGYFPDTWKKAIVRLIPKQGKTPHKTENYRPISLLEVPGKILERIINSRLRRHLELNNKYNNNQFGFREGIGTTHALAIITEQIAQNKGDRGQCQIIFRDVTKAFDKVWHIGLKFKILHQQLPTTIEKLLCDFLDDRTAALKIDNYIGPSFELASGVPQGSVLSPTLYTIFTNDLEASDRNLNICYADDITQITGYKGKSKNILNRQTEREILKVNDFEKKWRIKTNLTKFTPLHLGARITNPLIIDEDPIEFKSEGKCLGLLITINGYNKHIQDRNNKALAALKKLYRLQHMPEKIKIHLVKALVLPILEYPPIPTHALSQTQVSKLQKIQNKALRFATNQRYPYTMNKMQIHQYTKTLPLNIKLHERAKRVWDRLEDLQHHTLTKLKENRENIQNYNRNFPSSLSRYDATPNPKYY